MLPHIGTVCKFTFTSKFAILNGIYRATSLVTFENARANGVNFVDSLYTPAELSEQDYINDYASYVGSNCVTLQSVTDSTVTYYVPEAIIATVPDPTVREYPTVFAQILIGQFKDPAEYTWIKGQIDDIVSSVTGQTFQVRWKANPNFTKWMTEGEYLAMDETRKENIKKIAPLQVQIQQQLALINQLQSTVAALEEQLISIATTQQ